MKPLALLLVVVALGAGCREVGGDADADADEVLDGGPSGVGEPCHYLSDCEAFLFCGVDGFCYDPTVDAG